MDLSVNVLTNLTLLTDEILEEMKKNPLLSVKTSIYSINTKCMIQLLKLKVVLRRQKTIC